MTYIVGFKQPGINVIISDSRVSWKGDYGREGRNDAMKTGMLFPGCIFGRIGDTAKSKVFIDSFRESVKGEKDTIAGLWQRFEKFVETYPFSTNPNDQFQLLLSQRAYGEPRFHCLDSNTGLTSVQVPHSNYLLDYGSGKKILGPYIKEQFAPRLKLLKEKLRENPDLPIHAIPYITSYFLCLWLSELSLTTESSMLEEKDVGGAFHFIIQSSKGEESQKPALYIFSSINHKRKEIYAWCYRVAYVQGGVYLEVTTPPNQTDTNPEGITEKQAYFDIVSSPGINQLSEEELKEQIRKEVAAQPFYFFCGFGFTDARDRTGFGFIASTKGKLEDIFNEDGGLQLNIQAFINNNIDKSTGH